MSSNDETVIGQLKKSNRYLADQALKDKAAVFLTPRTPISVTSRTGGQQIIAPNTGIKQATVTNLDGTNNLRIRIGGALTATEGHIVPPQSTAFMSVADGDALQYGVWAIAEVSAVNIELSTG